MIAGAIVGVKGMIGFGIHHDFRRGVGCPQRLTHSLDGVLRNAGVFSAVQTKHRGVEIDGDIYRVLRRIQ